MKLSRDYLEFQADRLEAVLSAHRVSARVSGGTVSPRWVRFDISTPAGSKVGTLRNLSEEIAMALGTDEARVTRKGAALAIEVPRPDPQAVTLGGVLDGLQQTPRATAVLGLSELGRPLLVRLPSPNVAHILVAGTTGSGKTELMRTLILSLALTNRPAWVQLLLIDPKGRGFAPLQHLPHLLGPVVTNAEQAVARLMHLVDEMTRRDQLRICEPRIVVAVDEVPDLLMHGGPKVLQALTRLAQRGREAGIHLVLGAQKPASSVFDGQLKANFPVRLVGRTTSADEARVAAGIGGTGAEKLLGRGDFLAISAGEVTRFQVALVAAAEWPALLMQVKHR